MIHVANGVLQLVQAGAVTITTEGFSALTLSSAAEDLPAVAPATDD